MQKNISFCCKARAACKHAVVFLMQGVMPHRMLLACCAVRSAVSCMPCVWVKACSAEAPPSNRSYDASSRLAPRVLSHAHGNISTLAKPRHPAACISDLDKAHGAIQARAAGAQQLLASPCSQKVCFASGSLCNVVITHCWGLEAAAVKLLPGGQQKAVLVLAC